MIAKLFFIGGKSWIMNNDDQEIICYDGEKLWNKYRHSRYVFREFWTKTYIGKPIWYRDNHYYEVLRATMLPGYGRYLFIKFKRRDYENDLNYKEIEHGFHNFMFVEYGLSNPIAYYTERERKDITYVFDKLNK